MVGIARFGSVKSLGTATAAVFDLRAAQSLFDKGSRYDSILVGRRDGVSGARRTAVAAAVGPPLRCRPPATTTASRSRA